MDVKRIPFSEAKKFAQKFGQDQIVIVCKDNKNDREHVITWGKTIEDCKLAAESGNNLKRHMGWPETMCHETPSRLKKKGITL